MAPKRKRRPKESEHITESLILTDEKRDNLVKRGFFHGRKVELRGLEDLHLQETFEKIGWETFLNVSRYPYPDRILEFYTEYKFNEAEGIVEFQMYDQLYTMTLDAFCTALQLPRAETQIYTTVTNLDSISKLVSRSDLIRAICQDHINPEKKTHIKEQSLLENVKVWNKIVVANIFPRGGNTDRLGALQAYLLYCLVKGIKVDIGYIVAKRMDGVIKSNRKLPYGLLLNRLFDKLSLPFCGSTSGGGEINATTVRNLVTTDSYGEDVFMDVDDEIDRDEDWRNGYKSRFCRLENEVSYMRRDLRALQEVLDDQYRIMEKISEQEQSPLSSNSPSSSDSPSFSNSPSSTNSPSSSD